MLCTEVLKERVFYYMQQLDFPPDARADLLTALDRICADDAAFAAVSDMCATYADDCHCHFTPFLEQTDEICRHLGIHP